MELAFSGSIYEINVTTILLRLLMALVFGGMIGVERGYRQSAAGLRTHMLLCMGAASTMLVSQYIYMIYEVGDPARLSAQVISGIGFLGAGTIMLTRRSEIKGLTTAASLWATACMGLAVGVGLYPVAIIMLLLVMLALCIVNPIERRYLKLDVSTAMYVEIEREQGLGDVIRYVHTIEWQVREIRELPSGRPDVMAVRLDLETQNAKKGDMKYLRAMKENVDSVLRLEMIGNTRMMPM